MSLLNELQARGITTEDLEKAAAVRLFEKVAASEGVDLNALEESQVIELFENFTSTPTSSKEASAMNDAVIDLFEKTAAAEGIDLDEMSDEDLAELYEHYIENVLPEQLGDYDDDDDDVKVADAQEKLAEAEILGRHMARAYMDELLKEGAAPDPETARYYREWRAKNPGRPISEMKRDMMRADYDPRMPEPPSRKQQVAEAKRRQQRRAENPRGTQGPAATIGGKLRSMESRKEKAKATEALRESDRVSTARAQLKSRFYDQPMKSLGGFRNQIGSALGGGTRAAARLRGNIALGTVGALGAAGAGYGGYRAMRKESSFDDQVAAYLDELTGGGFSHDPAFDAALDILLDAGYDIDSLI